MKSYVIHLIRHGLTEANIKGRYAGVMDVPVCEEGIQKLKALKAEYKYPDADICFSSPLTRCLQTCKEIYPEKTPQIVEDLKEYNFGDWEGKTTDELSKNPEFISWLKNRENNRAPNGESGAEFYKRITNAFESVVEELMKKGVTSSAIFAHGGVITTLLSLYGIPQKRWMVENGCGYSIRITPGIWMRSKIFEVFDSIPHGRQGTPNEEIRYAVDFDNDFAKNQSEGES